MGCFGGGNSSQSSTSSSSTTNLTDNSDRRIDARTDASTRITDNSDNRQDNRQDNRIVDSYNTTNTTTNTDNSDNRQDNRQDNRVITINSLDAELAARAYENLETQSKLQAAAFEQSMAAQRAITDAANRTAAASVSAMQLSTSEAVRVVGNVATDSNRNLAALSSDSIRTIERVNSASLSAQKDLSRDAFSLAAELFDRSISAVTSQTKKDLDFAGNFLGNVFDQQKNADTQNLEKIVDAAKVITVVGLMAWAATRLRRAA